MIAANTVLDGKGVMHDARIVIEGTKIVAVEMRNGAKAETVDHDLRGLTVLPGCGIHDDAMSGRAERYSAA